MSLIDKLKHRSALQQAMDAVPLPVTKGGEIEKWQAEGWEYGDLPKMSQEYFDKFRAIAGDENLRWLTFASYGPDCVRGQYFISPTGRANLVAYLNENTN